MLHKLKPTSVADRVRQVIYSIFPDWNGDLNAHLVADLGGDSILLFTQLATALEREFSIHVRDADAPTLCTPNQCIAYVEAAVQ